MKIEIYLIRHSLTRGNEEKRYVGGRTDENLSSKGIELAMHKSAGFRNEKLMVFSGPMKRCRQTAEILFPDRKHTIVEKLREIDFGIFENRNYEELNGNALYQAWIDSGGKMDYPDGESQKDFTQRSVDGFLEVLHVLKENEKTRGAVICHGGNIMAIMSTLTGKEYFDFQVANTDGYFLELEIKGDEIVSLSYGSI